MAVKEKCNIYLNSMKNSILFKAILLNLIYLTVMLLLFEPFFSSDDYFMSNVVYGTHAEDYEYTVIYMNFMYGRIIVALLRFIPSIPWYTVLFYIWIFMALTLLVYTILKWNDKAVGLVISNIILVFFSYEGYIAIQFTKVAGIVGAAAVFVVVAGEKISWKMKLAAAGLWGIACMVRYDCTKMVLGAWGCVLLIDIVTSIWKYKNKGWNRLIKSWSWMAVIVGLFVLMPKLSYVGMSAEEKEAWRFYWKNNDVRVMIQDYVYPDYDSNKEVYDAIDVSKNDLQIYKGWNWDCNTMTLEKGAVIRALKNGDSEDVQTALEAYQSGEQEEAKQNTKEKTAYIEKIISLLKKVCSMKNIGEFFKIFPKSFLRIDVCTAYFMLVIFLAGCWRGRWYDFAGAVGVSSGILLLLMYYLYINGRYLQHRVDVGIGMAIIAIFLYLIFKEKALYEKRVEIKMLYLLSLLFLCGCYNYYWDDVQPVGDETMSVNQIYYEQMEKGSSRYMQGANRIFSSLLYHSYGAFDVPAVGAMKNEVKVGTKSSITGNSYLDVVDNTDMYFVLWHQDANEAAWETFFSEHAGKQVQLTQIKSFLNRKIFRVSSKSLEDIVEIPDNISSTNNIKADIECDVSDNQMTIDGTAYLAGESGFGQNTYIQIIDKETGEYALYDTLAVCDETKEYGDEGYFAQITANFSVPEFYSEYDTVYLILEQEGMYYRRQLVKQNVN